MAIWNFIYQKLQEKRTLMLLIVLDSIGSSPGRKGFKMAIADDDSMKGTIGGGVMEYKLIQKAKNSLKELKPSSFLLFQDHNPEADEDRSGLICSGKQTVACFPLDSSHLKDVQKITNNAKGVLRITPTQFEFKEKEILQEQIKSPILSGEKWEYTEQIGLQNRLFIFGAGHVGLALSKVFSFLNFQIELFDDRENIESFINNSFAHKKHLVSYKNIYQYIPEGENIYVVIMTAAHKSDGVVLQQLLAKNIRYIGMMGSRKKVNNIFGALRKQGFSEAQLKKVHAPIGLPIKSKTAEEIAISIAAEIIQVKNS